MILLFLYISILSTNSNYLVFTFYPTLSLKVDIFALNANKNG